MDARTPQPAAAPRFGAYAWMTYLAAAVVLTALYLFVPPFQGNAYLMPLLGLSGPLAVLAGVRLHRPTAPGAWLFFVAGLLLFVAGDVYTYAYPTFFHADVPFPSPGDGIYLTVYPALMAGLFVLVRRRNRGGDRSGLIDSLILTIGFAVLSWVFLIVPYLHLSGLSLTAKGVSIAYPLGDILLLAAAARLAVDAGRRAPSFYLLAGSILSLLVTDWLYTYTLLKGTYDGQLWLDAGWIAFYLLWGAAALHPSMRTLEEPSREARIRLTRGRLAVLAGASLIGQVIRFAQEWGNVDVLFLVVASAVLYLLVVWRMVGMVRGEERAAALRSAGAALVGAANADQIAEAAVQAAREIAGAEADVRVVTAHESGPGVVGADAGAPVDRWPLAGCDDEVAALVAADGPTLALGAGLRAGLRLADGPLVAIPLLARADRAGLLVVRSRRGSIANLVDALDALGAQIALALDGVTTAEDELRREGEARLRSLVAQSTDLITVLDRDGVVLYQSPSVERVLGHPVDQLEGRRFDAVLAEGDRPRLTHILAKLAQGHFEEEAWECSLRHGDGRWRQFEVQVSNLLGDEHVGGIVLNSRDVSERKAFEEQLAHQAFHDPITGLANRALFAERVRHALHRMDRDGALLGLLFIDLDEFKTINDSLGHAAGDVVLVEVARRIEGVVRGGDTVARFGGDEFAVLLEGIEGLQEAADVAERLIAELEESVDIDGKDVYAQASIGICLAGAGSSADADELIRNADVAMYTAKAQGKGRYRVFEPAMHEQVLERLELRADLQRAADAGQLQIHYQPVVRLRGSEVYGVEALMRWEHPERGWISPAQFIPLAEETGMIIPIGRWLLGEACREAVRVREALGSGDQLRMSVNLSVKQLQSETILADVEAALAESGLDPACLVLEITESVMMADTNRAVEQLNALKGLGIRLAMDDFGTGYSSLSYLTKLPVDILKMDRSFLQSGTADAGLAAAIVGLGDTLDLEVVAEGIERPEQMAGLRRLGCELGQGFLFAKAMDPQALLAFLHAAEAARDERAA